MEEKNKDVVIGIRGIQAIMLGIFALGLSMMLGDICGAINIPISSFSLTTTMFGAMGSILCEFFARKAEKW